MVARVHVTDLVRCAQRLHAAQQITLSPVTANLYVQQDQPPGVPPSLTGERTLPDVPAENYWYRRHLVVYEWIARRVAGRRVLDMACGECTARLRWPPRGACERRRT